MTLKIQTLCENKGYTSLFMQRCCQFNPSWGSQSHMWQKLGALNTLTAYKWNTDLCYGITSNKSIRQFISTLAVTSHKINTCSEYASKACLCAHVLAWLCKLNAKDADTEQVLLLCYVTTKVLVKCCISTYYFELSKKGTYW